MLRTTFLLVLVSRAFCHQLQRKGSHNRGCWVNKILVSGKLKRKTQRQNKMLRCVWGMKLKKKCATDIHAIIKCWIQLKDDDDLDRHSMLRKLSLNNKTDSPIDGLFKLSATWSDFKICYSTWLWWLSIAAYTPPPLPPPPRDFVRFP